MSSAEVSLKESEVATELAKLADLIKQGSEESRVVLLRAQEQQNVIDEATQRAKSYTDDSKGYSEKATRIHELAVKEYFALKSAVTKFEEMGGSNIIESLNRVGNTIDSFTKNIEDINKNIENNDIRIKDIGNQLNKKIPFLNEGIIKNTDNIQNINNNIENIYTRIKNMENQMNDELSLLAYNVNKEFSRARTHTRILYIVTSILIVTAVTGVILL